MATTPLVDNPQWEHVWDLQYDLCRRVDALLDESLDGYAPIWRSMACQYLIEHLAESARSGVALPPLPESAPKESSDVNLH